MEHYNCALTSSVQEGRPAAWQLENENILRIFFEKEEQKYLELLLFVYELKGFNG